MLSVLFADYPYLREVRVSRLVSIVLMSVFLSACGDEGATTRVGVAQPEKYDPESYVSDVSDETLEGTWLALTLDGYYRSDEDGVELREYQGRELYRIELDEGRLDRGVITHCVDGEIVSEPFGVSNDKINIQRGEGDYIYLDRLSNVSLSRVLDEDNDRVTFRYVKISDNPQRKFGRFTVERAGGLVDMSPRIHAVYCFSEFESHTSIANSTLTVSQETDNALVEVVGLNNSDPDNTVLLSYSLETTKYIDLAAQENSFTGDFRDGTLLLRYEGFEDDVIYHSPESDVLLEAESDYLHFDLGLAFDIGDGEASALLNIVF
jgi:hypothetical protein